MAPLPGLTPVYCWSAEAAGCDKLLRALLLRAGGGGWYGGPQGCLDNQTPTSTQVSGGLSVYSLHQPTAGGRARPHKHLALSAEA